MRRRNRGNVGALEVAPFEQHRLISGTRQSKREAVAKIIRAGWRLPRPKSTPAFPHSAEAQALKAFIGERAHCQDKWLADIDQMLTDSGPIRPRGRADAFPNSAVVDGNAGQQKPGIAQPLEIVSDEFTALLAYTAVCGEVGGYRAQVFVDGIGVHRDPSLFCLLRSPHSIAGR